MDVWIFIPTKNFKIEMGSISKMVICNEHLRICNILRAYENLLLPQLK